jgi:aromatic ring hydroxylase
MCKSAWNRKIIGGVAESDLHTQLQCTTLASKIATYMRERGVKYDETFKIIKFPWFLSVSVF